jgi:hypothetical protein
MLLNKSQILPQFAIMTTLDPPSMQETIADPTNTLGWISHRLAAIYSHETVSTATETDRTRYLNIYNGVWTYLQALPQKGLRSSHVIASERGAEVYALLKSYVAEYCRQSQMIVTAPSDPVDILRVYTAQWSTYSHLSERVSRMFKLLDDHWVRRELDEAAFSARARQEPLYLIPELHRVIWRESMLSEDRRLLDAFRTVRTKVLDSRADAEEGRVLEECMASLKALGLALSEEGTLASVS